VLVTGIDARYLELTMTLLLLAVAVYTILGGMLSVLVTDFLQFVVMSVGLLAVTFLVLARVGWTAIADAVTTKIGAGGFDPFANPNLGWSFVIFQILSQFAVVLTWQTVIARVLAAKDAKTGQRIYTGTAFFFICRFMIPALWGMAALALLPADVVGSNTLHAMPKLLASMLPMGLLGLVVAAMLAADMSTDSSYMLTWAGIIYNDILRPFRKGPWSERKGLLVNRLSVAGIGVFLLLYGLWYPLQGDLWSYLLLTGTIYFASMSVLLVACLYWKRANAWGAGAAIAAGALVPLTYLVLQLVPSTAAFAARTGANVWGIAAFAAAALAMVVGSTLKPQPRQVTQ
jgi:SSS family solute:Na+ symporter